MGLANYNVDKVNAVLEAVENTPRKKYYEDMGITLENVTSLESALKLSGLDYSVEKRPIQFVNKVEQEWNGKKILVDPPFVIPDQFVLTPMLLWVSLVRTTISFRIVKLLTSLTLLLWEVLSLKLLVAMDLMELKASSLCLLSP